jgi:acyl transferase domain-containing protein
MAVCFEPWLSLHGSAVVIIRASALAVAECHATGTAVGDVIELDAIGSVYGDARPADQPLRVASVKGNIGHAEMAAGIFSIAKVGGMSTVVTA